MCEPLQSRRENFSRKPTSELRTPGCQHASESPACAFPPKWLERTLSWPRFSSVPACFCTFPTTIWVHEPSAAIFCSDVCSIRASNISYANVERMAERPNAPTTLSFCFASNAASANIPWTPSQPPLPMGLEDPRGGYAVLLYELPPPDLMTMI